MKVEVRLFAALASYLPGESDDSAVTVELPEGETVASAIRRLGIPDTMPLITLVNGRDAAPDQPLRDGDVLSVFPPLAGGG
jgi:molybdopterin converting factor small subunit